MDSEFSPGSGLHRGEDGVGRARAVFAAGGEMGSLMAELDWRATALGDPDGWTPSLVTAVGVCLESRFPMLIWWGSELVMIYNDSYAPMLGGKHPQAMGQAGAECWPEIWDVIGPMLGGVMSSGTATWSEDQLLLLERNGYEEECYFTFSYSPIRDEQGAIAGVFTAVFETTERVIGERRLNCLRELADVRAGADTGGEVIEQTVTVLDRDVSDLPFTCIYPLGDDGTVQEGACAGLCEPAAPDIWPLERVIAQQTTLDLETLPALERRNRLGPAPTRAVVLPIYGRSGRDVRAVLVCGVNPRRPLDDGYRSFLSLVAEDISAGLTASRAREEERRQAEALAALDEAKTRFFSNISHEFRTPLTLLMGPLDDLLAGPEPLTEAQREALLLGRRNAMRMRRLVNALLDLSRAQGGRLTPALQPVDLAAHTAELARAFAPAVQRAGLELEIDCPALGCYPLLDVQMWETIVLNLLSNALKHTWEGKVGIRLSRSGGRIQLEVFDTGIGIEPGELPHLFERFHRVRDARARSEEGSGIGLALVAELAQLHGGEVSVSSRPGVGTSFTVRIPLRDAGSVEGASATLATPGADAAAAAESFLTEAERWGAVAASEPAGGEQAGDGEDRARVLVVDDSADMREYLARLLSGHFEVSTAPNGRVALEVISRQRPDLVVTDVMMPELDGLGLLRAIRDDPSSSTLPVILLSARAGEESSVDGLEAGADDYLVKPFSGVELLARVKSNLGVARIRTEAGLRATRWAQRLEALATASQRVVSGLEPDEVARTLAHEARGLLGAAGASVTTLDDRVYTAGDTQASGASHEQELSFPATGRAGTLRLFYEQGAAIDEQGRALCEQLALVAAGAINRARAHAFERETILRLQESLLPQRLPTDPSLQLAVRYLAASSSAAVGGDWYDAFALPDGRYAFIVGDVVGHGLEAAATMSSLRNMLHVFLIEGDGPGRALARMHAVIDRTEMGLTATLCCLLMEPQSGSCVLASAGHPPPLLVGADGRAAYLELAGAALPALGIGAESEPLERRFTLGPGETLMLYSDGLIEPRDHSDGFLAFPPAAEEPDGDLDTYCDRLIDRLAPPEARRDDVALLALRRLGAGELSLELRPTANLSSGAHVRRAMRPWLAGQALGGEFADEALLAVSEAVNNAVEHSGVSAHGQVSVRARIDGRTLHVVVRDAGGWREPGQQEFRGHGLALIRGLMDDVAIDAREDGTRIEMVRTAAGG